MKHPRGKSYDPEFKLRLAKEFAETDKTLEEIAQENGISSKGPCRLEVAGTGLQ